MKMLPLPDVDSSKVTWSQACMGLLGPLLALTLIAFALWVMPIVVFFLLYFLLLGAGFWDMYVKDRALMRHEGTLNPRTRSSCELSMDSFQPPYTPRELHLELIKRSIKEIHARNQRLASEKSNPVYERHSGFPDGARK